MNPLYQEAPYADTVENHAVLTQQGHKFGSVIVLNLSNWFS